MATGAGRAADLAVKDAIAERHHLLGGARGNGKRRRRGGGAGIGVRAFRGLGVIALISPPAADALGQGVTLARRPPAPGSAAVDDAIDPSA